MGHIRYPPFNGLAMFDPVTKSKWLVSVKAASCCCQNDLLTNMSRFLEREEKNYEFLVSTLGQNDFTIDYRVILIRALSRRVKKTSPSV